MNTQAWAAQVAARWVRCYTAGVDAEAARSRHAEIASDVFEQRAHGRSVDAPPLAVAVSILWRVVGGVPADLVWSRQQRVASRGRPPQKEAAVMSRITRMAQHGWWRLAAGAVVGFYAYVIVGNLLDPQGPYPGGLLLCAVATALVLTGLGLYGPRRPVADLLVALGVAPALLAIWFWPVAVTALVVIVLALVDLADSRALRHAGRPRA